MGLGYDGNIYQSPESIVGSSKYGTQNDIVKSDSFSLYSAGFDLARKVSKRTRLKMDYGYGAEKYSTAGVLDNSSHEVDLEYRYKPSKDRSFTVEVDYKRKEKSETDILGKEYTQKYSYDRYKFSPTVSRKYAPGKIFSGLGRTLVKISLEAMDKNYDEAPLPTTSLDYAQYSGEFRLSQEITDSLELKGEFEYRSRSYKNDPAKKWYGTDVIEEKRIQNYHIYKVGLKKKFDKKSRIKVGYEKRNRIDPYEDYYSYGSSKYSIDIKYRIFSQLYLTADIEHESRLYVKQMVPIVGLPLLQHDYRDYKLGLTAEITPYAEVLLECRLDRRDAGPEVESSLYERSYSRTEFFGIIRAEF